MGHHDNDLIKAEKKRRKQEAHRLKYNFKAGPYAANEDHHHGATKIGALVRGGSARRLAKREAEKQKQRTQLNNQKAKGMKGQPPDAIEDRALVFENPVESRAVQHEKKKEEEKHAPRKKPHETRAAPGAYNHYSGKNKNKVHVEVVSAPDKGYGGARIGNVGDNYLEDRSEVHESIGRVRHDTCDDEDADIEKALQSERLVIYAADDDETKAYKAKLNYLADKKAKEAKATKNGETPAGDPKPLTDEKDDFCVLGCLGVCVLMYYGGCAFLWIEVNPLIAVFLGVVCPFTLAWLLKGWKQAKKDGKKALFLW